MTLRLPANPNIPAEPESASGQNRIVVTFDLCSSSSILEDLTLTGNVGSLGQALGHLDRFIRERTKCVGGEVYKFTGDGWILLLPHALDGVRLVKLLVGICEFTHYALRNKIVPFLESTPSRMGITIGIDSGPLLPIKLAGVNEWLGRPLNVACRLQAAIKDNDQAPEYKALMSKHTYQRYRSHFASYRPQTARRELRNIHDDQTLEYRKVTLFRPDAAKKAPAEINNQLQLRIPESIFRYIKQANQK